MMIKLSEICFTTATRIEIVAQALTANSSYMICVIELNCRWNLSSYLNLLKAVDCLIFEYFDWRLIISESHADSYLSAGYDKAAKQHSSKIWRQHIHTIEQRLK